MFAWMSEVKSYLNLKLKNEKLVLRGKALNMKEKTLKMTQTVNLGLF
jgi:hypothetical protein